MALPLLPRAVPQCTSCLRNYAFGTSLQSSRPAAPVSKEHVRGKSKLSKTKTMPVKLLKDVDTYGRAGTYVPVYQGRMRNEWYPKRIADYVRQSELRVLKKQGNIVVKRDYAFGISSRPQAMTEDGVDEDPDAMTAQEREDASLFQRAPLPDHISPERSAELLEIFIPHRLDFHRQLIAEEPKPESAASKARQGMGAAADLMAAREADLEELQRLKSGLFHGSVSTHDVWLAVRKALEVNDEAQRVVIQEPDVHFVDLPAKEVDKDRVKHIGDYTVEVRVRGSGFVIRRPLRVIPREA